MGRRIHEAEIKYISLVPRGANRMPVIYKSDGAFDIEMLLKCAADFADKGELLAVVYAPEQRDSQGDIASAEVIKDMMYKAAKDGVNIDIRHDEAALTKEQAYVAESFLIQKNDPRFNGFSDYDNKPVDVTGAWGVVMKIDDPRLRKLYKEGKWNGVSMGGRAKVETEKSDNDLADRIVNGLAAKMNGGKTGDKDMTKEEMEAVFKAQGPVIAAAIAVEVAKALKPAEPVAGAVAAAAVAKTEELAAPIFKGDRTNPADLKTHREALVKFNLAKSVDWNDPASIEKYEAELAKLDAPKLDENGDPIETPVVEAKANKASNQSVGATGKSTVVKNGEETGLSKEDMDNMELGRKMAKSRSK